MLKCNHVKNFDPYASYVPPIPIVEAQQDHLRLRKKKMTLWLTIYLFAALPVIRHAAGNYCILGDAQELTMYRTTVSYCGILLCSLRSVR